MKLNPLMTGHSSVGLAIEKRQVYIQGDIVGYSANCGWRISMGLAYTVLFMKILRGEMVHTSEMNERQGMI